GKPLRGFQILGLFKKTKGASPSSITNRAKITANLAQFSCLRSQARAYVSEQFDLWRNRSQRQWKIDLSYLENHFDIFILPESVEQRTGRAESFYQEKLAEYRQRQPAGES
ncbi:MAG: hypothetical protein ACLQVY_04900, partial [Limisphaerales bacterium]